MLACKQEKHAGKTYNKLCPLSAVMIDGSSEMTINLIFSRSLPTWLS